MNIQKSSSFPSVPGATFLTAVKMSSFAYVAYKSSIELHKKDFPQVIEIDGEQFSLHTSALLKRYTGVEYISCETYITIYYPMIDGKEDTDANPERLKLALSRARTDSIITSAISSMPKAYTFAALKELYTSKPAGCVLNLRNTFTGLTLEFYGHWMTPKAPPKAVEGDLRIICSKQISSEISELDINVFGCLYITFLDFDGNIVTMTFPNMQTGHNIVRKFPLSYEIPDTKYLDGIKDIIRNRGVQV